MSRLKRFMVGAFVAVTVALSVIGLFAVGALILLAIAMSQYGSAK